MKTKIYALLLTLLFCSATLSAQDLWQEANQAYTQEEYEKSIELYNQLMQEQGTSSALYYNMGNAYYKTKAYSAAILNFERALLLEPSNEDAAFNLKMAQMHIVDKIEPVGTFFLTLWMQNLAQLMSTNRWAVVAITTFILALLAVMLYIFSRQVAVRKTAFFGAILLLLFSVAANRFAYVQKQQLTQRNCAIVFAPTITVKSSPADSGTDLFVLHEGTKVTVLGQLGEWSEVKLVDGNRGWMPSDKLEVI